MCTVLDRLREERLFLAPKKMQFFAPVLKQQGSLVEFLGGGWLLGGKLRSYPHPNGCFDSKNRFDQTLEMGAD